MPTRTELFLQVKGILRNHPDWDDDQVAERAGLKEPEREVIIIARRDLEAG